MARSDSHRLALGSVSALAIACTLAACTQPASYATVDLGGSYGSGTQTAQAYSSTTGQPVYQSTSLYGPQSFPDAPVYQSTSQLAYSDAPVNQVASLGSANGGFDTFGITEAPTYAPLASTPPVYSSPSFQEADLLSSPQFQQEIQSVDRAFIDTGPLDAPAPQAFADPAPLESYQPITNAVPFETAYAVPSQPLLPSAPVAQTAAPRFDVIEEAELAPITLPAEPLVPQTSAPYYPSLSVADDYATVQGQAQPTERKTAPVEDTLTSGGRSPYEPWIVPQFGSQEGELEAAEQGQQPAPTAQRPIARAPIAPSQPEPAAPSGPDNAFTEAARDLLPQRAQQTRMPTPNAVPTPPVSIGGGVRIPKASTEYPRPYEALRPGVWPELPNPGEGMVEAPVTTPVPQLASAEPPVRTQPVEQLELASERLERVYTIQHGDTLLTIGQRFGVHPEELAFENGMTPDAQIYIGQELSVPSEPHAAVDAAAAPAIQKASAPTHQTTSAASARFTWPVEGEVYRLDAGQVEIDATGNADVAASAAGRVVHVERGAMGVLVVIEHDNGWRSLTVGLDNASVQSGQTVRQGMTIGEASRDHRVRFELRDAGAGVADALAHLRG